MGALLIALMSTASADLVNWSFDGAVTSITDPGSPALWASSIAPGAPIHLSFSGDSNASPTFSLPAQGIFVYDLVGSAMDLGALHFDLTLPSLSLGNDPATTPTTIAFGAISPNPNFTVTVQLTSSQDVVPTFAVPTTLPLLSKFDQVTRITIMEQTPSTERWEAVASISSIHASATPVPEPSSYALIAAAAALTLCATRRLRSVVKK